MRRSPDSHVMTLPIQRRSDEAPEHSTLLDIVLFLFFSDVRTLSDLSDDQSQYERDNVLD